MIKRKKDSGFTLIEMIMAIVILAAIALVFSIVISAGIDSWFFMKGQREHGGETFAAMKRMIGEIRRTNDSNITIFSSAEYEFRDIDGNIINFRKNGANLERNGRTLLEHLASNGLRFVYLDKNNSAASTNEAIRTVQIFLIVEEGDNRVRLQGAASIRSED